MRMSNDYTEHGEELEADEPTPLLRRTRYVAWLLLAGMWVCSGTHRDSNPRSSSNFARSAGLIE